MKQKVSPAILVTVIAIGVVVIGLIGYRVWSAPSVVPAPEVAKASAGGAAGAKKEVGLAGGGGPSPEALKYRDEYNKAHPNAEGSR